MKREWKDIPGYEGIYQASSDGKIKAVAYVYGARGTLLHTPGKIIPPQKKTNPYYRVFLFSDDASRDYRVHELVVLTFIGERPKGKQGQEIRHKDNDPKNNHYKNLAYSSAKRNNKDKASADTRAYGEKSGASILTFKEVGEIRRLKANGKSNNYLEKKFGVKVSEIVNGETWNPKAYEDNIAALEKLGKKKSIQRLKQELEIISPKEWLEFLSKASTFEGNSKLLPEQVGRIRFLYEIKKKTIPELANKYSVTAKTIKNITTYYCWNPDKLLARANKYREKGRVDKALRIENEISLITVKGCD